MLLLGRPNNWWKQSVEEVDHLCLPEICSAIRKFVREEFGFKRFTMHLVDNGASRDYTSYGVLPLSKDANASDHFDLQWQIMLNTKGVDE